MSRIVVDASVTLQWFLEDELGRDYSLAVLNRLNQSRGVVPSLWLYEVGNGLLVAHRRNRISLSDVQQFLGRILALPIDIDAIVPTSILDLPLLAQRHALTNYDAAYLAVAIKNKCEMATRDTALRAAAVVTGVTIFEP